jgi:hypothetical protein
VIPSTPRPHKLERNVEYKYGDTKLVMTVIRNNVMAVIRNNVIEYELCVYILNFPKLNTLDEYFCIIVLCEKDNYIFGTSVQMAKLMQRNPKSTLNK